MKTKSRNILRRLAGLMVAVVMLTGMDSTAVMAADLNSIESLNAGAAEVLDSIDTMTEEELAEVATSDEDREEAQEVDEAAEAAEAAKEVKEAAEEAEAAKEEYTLVMADVNASMNIRQEPTTDSAKVGLLYADCGGTILERSNGWTKIQSGNLVGWANDEYLIFGEEAQQKAQEVGIYRATVTGSGLRIRKEPTTESGIWDQVEQGDVYEAITEYTTEDWVAIEYGGALGYISAEYVTMEFTIDHGETFTEIEEREKREREEKQRLIVNEGSSAIGTTDDMLLAALIQCEAGNQPYEGQVAVGAVVMNRVNSGAYPNTIAGVIYASGQFTPTRTGKVEELAVNGVKDSCLQAARAAMNGESPVGGAMHFRRAGKHEGQVIGDHVFW